MISVILLSPKTCALSDFSSVLRLEIAVRSDSLSENIAASRKRHSYFDRFSRSNRLKVFVIDDAAEPVLERLSGPNRPGRRLVFACTWTMNITEKIPGLALVSALALVAYAAIQLPFLARVHPMILALLLGIALRTTLKPPAMTKSGIVLSQRHLLRLAVALLGIQLSFSQIAGVGLTGLAVVLTALVATFAFTTLIGRAMGIDRQLCELIAAGTSVCGASAIVATNTVTRAPEEDVAYAIASVTLFGTASMLLYPLALPLLPLDSLGYGLWTGASIHEVAQVAAAAFQGGDEAGALGTVSKLARVVMLAPLVLALGWYASLRVRGAGPTNPRPVPVPLFVLGFLALAALNSVIEIDASIHRGFAQLTAFLMTAALAAIGLQTDISELKMRGIRPFLLGLFAWIFISGGTLALVVALF